MAGFFVYLEFGSLDVDSSWFMNLDPRSLYGNAAGQWIVLELRSHRHGCTYDVRDTNYEFLQYLR